MHTVCSPAPATGLSKLPSCPQRAAVPSAEMYGCVASFELLLTTDLCGGTGRPYPLSTIKILVQLLETICRAEDIVPRNSSPHHNSRANDGGMKARYIRPSKFPKLLMPKTSSVRTSAATNSNAVVTYYLSKTGSTTDRDRANPKRPADQGVLSPCCRPTTSSHEHGV